MRVSLSHSVAVSALGGGVFARAYWSMMPGARLGMTATKTIKIPNAGAALMR